MEEGLEHFLEEGVGDGNHVGDIACHKGCAMSALAHFGAGYGGSEETIGDSLGVGVGETLLGEVVDEVVFESCVELAERAGRCLALYESGRSVANALGESGEGFGELIGCLDDMAEAVAEGSGPAGVPSFEGLPGIRPLEALAEGLVDVGEGKRCVAAVPSEHAQSRHVAAFLVEVGEGDLARLVLWSEGGDEKKVFGIPCGAVGFVCRCTLFDDEVGEDAAQHNDREFFAVELDEENAPLLVRVEGAELADGFYLGGVFRSQAEFFGFVVKNEVFKIIPLERPAEFVLEVADELVEGSDVAEIGSGHGWVEF
jgi:hypothetical protein